jgi:hypothetical protein
MPLALIPLVEQNTPLSDIRYSYPQFVNEGAATQWNDPRILTRTYRGEPIQALIRTACLEIINFFLMDRAHRLEWMQHRANYTRAQARTFVDFTLTDASFPFRHVLLAPYMDMDHHHHPIHRLQLSLCMAYKTQQNVERWLVIHYKNDHIQLRFDISQENAEDETYDSGEDPLTDANDNPIMFIELNELSVADMWNTHGGRAK